MKGLLVKDYYIIKSSLLILAVVFIIIGTSLSYLSTPWVLTVLATVLLGMIVAGMQSTDMGGPINKASYVFATPQLAEGNFADFVVLDQNILQIPAEDITKTKVMLTVADGKIVYER